MQAPLALLGFVFGLAAWWQTDAAAFVVGAVLIVANWPWTLMGMLPTNNAIMAAEPAEANAQTRALIVLWGRLHAVRTALGLAATVAFFWGCVGV